MTALDDLFDGLLADGAAGSMILDRRRIVSRPILRLVDRLLATDALVFEEPSLRRRTDERGDVVLLDGRVSVLGLDRCSAEAVFGLVGDEVGLAITLKTSPNWRLSQAFPALKASDFDRIELREGMIRFASHDAGGARRTVRDGLDLGGLISAGDVLTGLGPILGAITTVAVTGSIRPVVPLGFVEVEGGETSTIPRIDAPDAKLSVRLVGPTPIDVDVPGFAFSDVALLVEGPIVRAMMPYPDVRRGLTATLTIDGHAVDVAGSIGAVGVLSLRAAPRDVRLPDLSVLARLLPDGGFADLLPDGFGDLSGLALTQIDLDVDVVARTIAFLGIGLKSDGAWSTAGGAVTLASPSVHLMAHRPASPRRSLRCLFAGDVTLGGIAVRVTGIAPHFVFTGSIPELPITRFIGAHVPELADVLDVLPDVDLREVEISVSPETGDVSFRAECKGRGGAVDDPDADEPEALWTLQVGVTPIVVRDLAIEVRRRGGGRSGKAEVSGLFTGRVAIADAEFAIEYAFPGDFVLSGKIPEVSFSPLLQAVAGTEVFRDLPLPEALLDLALTDVYFVIAPQRRSFTLAAATAIGEVEIVLQKTANGSWGCAMGIAPSVDWRFSSLSPELAALDAVRLDRTTLIVATTDDGSLRLSTITPGRPDVRPNRELTLSAPPRPIDARIHRGLNVFSTISLAGTGADRVLGQSELKVYAAVGPRLSDMALEARLDGEIALADNVTLGDIGFRLIPDPSNFSITLLCRVSARIGDDDLVFVGGLEVQPNGATLQQTMKGTWTDAFGVAGLDVTDVALDLGLSFSPPLPTVGIAGTIAVGGVVGEAAVRFDSKNPIRSMLHVKIDHLTVMDLVSIFAGASFVAGVPIETRGLLATIGMENVDVHVVPTPTRIGELLFEQGLRAAGRLFLQDFTAEVRIEVDPSGGVGATGTMTPIDLAGLFTVSGSRSDIGPRFSFDLRAGHPFGVMVDGRVEILGIAAEASIRIDQSGFDFEVSGPVFGLFRGTVHARGGRLGSDVGFMLSVRMDTELIHYLARNAARAIQTAANEANAQFSAAQAAFAAEQQKLARYDAAIAQARAQVRLRNRANLDAALAEVARWSAEVRRLDVVVAQQRAAAAVAQRDAQSGIDAAVAKVEAADRDVRSLQSAIDDQKAWIRRLEADIAEKKRSTETGPVLDRIRNGLEFGPFSLAKGAEITVAYGKIGGLEAARGTAWAALEAAKGILSLARKSSAPVLNDLNLAIQGPLGAQKAAQFALDQANVVLSRVRALTTDELVDLDPSVSSLLSVRYGAWGALEAARQYMELCKKTVTGVADVGSFIVENGLDALVDVRSVGFECSLVSGHGGAVDLDVTVGFMRQPPQTHRLSFNFHDPAAGARALANRLRPT